VELTTYKVRVTFITPVLGSQPTRDIAAQYLAKKHGFELAEDEVESLPDALDAKTTAFHRVPTPSGWTEYDEDGRVPGLFNYQVKGFLKHAGKVLNAQLKSGGKPLRALRSKVGNLVFVDPRQIPLHVPADGELDVMERPLRAQTARGERVAIARSEVLPEGTWFEAGLSVWPGQITQEVLEALLDYGMYQGIGQWRSGGWGQFRYELSLEDV